MNMLYNIHDMWGLDVIRLQRSDDLYGAFTTSASIDGTNLLELYGVKYVISVTPIDKKARFDLYLVLHDGSLGVHNPNYIASLLDAAQRYIEQEISP